MSLDLEAGLGERLAGGRGRAGEHDRRVGAGDGGGDDPGARREAEVGADLLGADRHQRGAVDDARGVAGVVDVVDPLDPVVLLERHVVEAGVRRRCRRSDGLSPARPSGLVSGRIVSSWSSTVRPLRSLTGTTAFGEVAVGPGLGGAVVRLGGVRVDVVAAPALDRGDQVGADALRHEAGLERGGRVGRPGAAVGAHRHPAHRLDAAGEDQVLEAAADAGRGLVDGLEAGGAEAVELHAGDGLGVAGLERGGLGDVAALLADRRDHAEHDVVDARRVERGVAHLDLVEEADDQVDRLDLVQRARPSCPCRAASGCGRTRMLQP